MVIPVGSRSAKQYGGLVKPDRLHQLSKNDPKIQYSVTESFLMTTNRCPEIPTKSPKTSDFDQVIFWTWKWINLTRHKLRRSLEVMFDLHTDSRLIDFWGAGCSLTPTAFYRKLERHQRVAKRSVIINRPGLQNKSPIYNENLYLGHRYRKSSHSSHCWLEMIISAISWYFWFRYSCYGHSLILFSPQEMTVSRNKENKKRLCVKNLFFLCFFDHVMTSHSS